MKPTIGRIIHYRLTEEEKKILADYETHQKSNNTQDVLPGIITAVWSDTCINVQLFVDGQTGVLWRTSISQGVDVGQWYFPVIK